MNKSHLLGGGLTLLAGLMLAACNSNDDDNAAIPAVVQTTQVTVTPSLGKILNAKVVLKNAKTGATLGNGNTGSTGIATFTATKTSDPVVVEVQGVDGAQGATYFDEAKSADIALPATQKIRAIVPTLTDNANVGVTVLTEVATQAAIKAAGDLSKVTTQVATDANNQIKNLLAKELGTASLLTPPTIIGKDTSIKSVITVNNTANSYALKLAGLAKLGTGNTPVLDLLQKLSDDLSDNKLDGMKGTADVNYETGTATTDAIVALQNYISAYVNVAQLNGIYTTQILNGFKVVEGEIKITITTGNAGGGTGSNGSVCLATATSNLVVQGIPVSQTNKYCYINFPTNAVCSNANTVLSGFTSNINIQGVTGNISFSYNAAASCPADTTVKYDYATGQVVVNIPQS